MPAGIAELLSAQGWAFWVAALVGVTILGLAKGGFAGLGVLDLGDFPDAFFILKDIAGANIDAADLHGADGLLQVMTKSKGRAGKGHASRK